MSVVGWYDFVRVNAVLAHHIQRHMNDGRYYRGVKKWIKHFTVLEDTHIFLDSHAILVNEFADHIRKLNIDTDAKEYVLPGKEVDGEHEPVHGYDIIRSIMVSDTEGYVIAHNPEAVSHYACWKLGIGDDGERRYDWGRYGDEQAAADAYSARVFVAFN